MANLITVGRICLLFTAVALIYTGNVAIISVCIILIAAIFALDGFDGWVARRRGETSQFGAVVDIAGDRIVENVLWVIFADLRLIPVWIPLLVLTRGFIVDGLRSISFAQGMTAFGHDNMMRSPLTRWLTAGRFMRGLFGYVKAIGFVFLTGLEASRHPAAAGTVIGRLYGVDAVRYGGWLLIGLAVALTIVRALPVIVDAFAQWGRAPSPPVSADLPATRPEERIRDGVSPSST
jgi:CDP-diacylglycerol--glycerol-3-phosphate 3-phosphatidyltransferase